MKNSGMNWKWWASGSVLLLAGVVGCYSAVVVKEAGQEHIVRKVAMENEEPPDLSALENLKNTANKQNAGNAAGNAHNGGKVRMPITASFDGDSELKITQETNAVISLTAEADLNRFSVYVQGSGALQDIQVAPITKDLLAAGETMRIEVTVPARTGSLIVRAVGDVGDSTMTASLELKVINPKEATAAAQKNDGSTVERDGLGNLIQSSPAGVP
ncbi:MAG: hypothetical protein JNJ49_10980 [Bdellovibrionaceae bacterium]|nr:hypothetical protein [Pseudobdellovibrionaceae bacterium]